MLFDIGIIFFGGCCLLLGALWGRHMAMLGADEIINALRANNKNLMSACEEITKECNNAIQGRKLALEENAILKAMAQHKPFRHR